MVNLRGWFNRNAIVRAFRARCDMSIVLVVSVILSVSILIGCLI